MSFKVAPEPDAERDAQWREWARRESAAAAEQQKQEHRKDDLDRD